MDIFADLACVLGNSLAAGLIPSGTLAAFAMTLFLAPVIWRVLGQWLRLTPRRPAALLHVTRTASVLALMLATVGLAAGP